MTSPFKITLLQTESLPFISVGRLKTSTRSFIFSDAFSILLKALSDSSVIRLEFIKEPPAFSLKMEDPVIGNFEKRAILHPADLAFLADFIIISAL